MKTALPLILWILFLSLAGEDVLQTHWEGAMVVFAALALVPYGLQLLHLPQRRWHLFSAIGLGAAYLFFPNQYAPILALPYLLSSAWLTVREFANLFIIKKLELLQWVRIAALVYWATGALWALCFLADIRPLGFDPVIVGLTAAHFHVAGFVLATVVYCLLSDAPYLTNKLLGWTTLAGMPLVAAGITLTKFGFSPIFEWASALSFVGFALVVVWQHIRLFSQKNNPRMARRLWLGGANCLLVGGVLASLYAIRFSFPMDWVNIPNMKIWHGTLNAIGFGWLVLQGWNRRNADSLSAQ